ncbi:MAG: RHS repeat-associated core domain-containing protein [Nanoarchaeota archaeon]|nr:RHS repeat-associated core domain-containing protein [Nanoarchaeota archaeon]
MVKKVGMLFVVLLVLFLPVVKAETLHPTSRETVRGIETTTIGEQQQRISSTGTKTYYYGTGLVAKEEDNELSYYHKDNLGSMRVVTNETGSKLEENTFLPYGENLEQSEETFGFTGKERDTSGLTYFGARYYDSSLGVFVTVDPIGDGINWYQYAASNPINRIDPLGLADEDDEAEFESAGADATSTPTVYVMPEVEVTATRYKDYNDFVEQHDGPITPAEHDMAMKVFGGKTSLRETGHNIYTVAMAFIGLVDLGMGISDAVINARYPAVSWYSRIQSTDYLDDVILAETKITSDGAFLGSDTDIQGILNKASRINKAQRTRFTLGVHGDPNNPGNYKIITSSGVVYDNIPAARIEGWAAGVTPSGEGPVALASCYGSPEKLSGMASAINSPVMGEVSGLKLAIGVTGRFSYATVSGNAATLTNAHVATFFPR